MVLHWMRSSSYIRQAGVGQTQRLYHELRKCSVIAGRMLVEASLHGLEKRRGWGDRPPLVGSLYKQIAWLMDSEEFCGSYVFEESKLAQLKT